MKRRGKAIKATSKNYRLSADTAVNTCISCGEIIPEGALVCIKCEMGWTEFRCAVCGKTVVNGRSLCSDCMEVILRPASIDRDED